MAKYRVKLDLKIKAARYFEVEAESKLEAYEEAMNEASRVQTKLWLASAKSIMERIPEADEVNLDEVVELVGQSE
jgi:hypothetical protein